MVPLTSVSVPVSSLRVRLTPMRLASRVVRLVAAPLVVAPSPLALPAATDVSDYFPTFTIEAHTDASYRVRWRQG